MTTLSMEAVIEQGILDDLGLRASVVRDAIQYTHRVLDMIDASLVEATSSRLTSLIELANFSAIVGNLFRSGIANSSGGGLHSQQSAYFPRSLGC